MAGDVMSFTGSRSRPQQHQQQQQPLTQDVFIYKPFSLLYLHNRNQGIAEAATQTLVVGQPEGKGREASSVGAAAVGCSRPPLARCPALLGSSAGESALPVRDVDSASVLPAAAHCQHRNNGTSKPAMQTVI
ncbi:hypothetical protein E2C01_049853 [Portunus trituberculatus]|uniref:Uncharacterized protein n=1 Tax=Portunus trituberculatus TaxID=210409 RepID=A0A5B7GEW2_PORTR|nr:hypothetical protein [Portunus trituberculatus]